MDKVLYNLMDWAAIEEIVYSEAAFPHQMLGPHLLEEGLLIQAFIPTAVTICVKLKGAGKEFPMDEADEDGFFAVLIPRKSITAYTLVVTYDNGVTEELEDPYAFKSLYKAQELKKFESGIFYDVYKKMGAHPVTIDDIPGVVFSVWAPCAIRASVVGDFNLWDGRRHQMRKLGDSGVFELFIPGLSAGSVYKYELKNMHGEPMLKADPYANYAELRPNNASVVWDITGYEWQDHEWMKRRAQVNAKDSPISIYEVHLGSWMRKEFSLDESGTEITGSEYYSYREIAVRLAAYVREMGYTHVELMPIMEHPLDASWGYQVTGYYAPTSRYGTPHDFKFFMDYMHEHGIGVILDWVPAHFPRDAFGMGCFDGTCVYEHQDPRQGAHPHWGTLIFNYGRPQVSNFLIANALFWIDEYHADGIRMDAVASMLYLDYGKQNGEWVANMYGGHENLEAVEFLRHLNSVVKKRGCGAVLIAEESTAWPMVTGDVKKGSLGFDYKWNMGWMNDFTKYMKCDPLYRGNHYGELTFSMIYAYSEDFVLVFSHDEVVHGKASMLLKMPGATMEAKADNLRAAYAFMIGHPGKKLLFMGQEFAQTTEWSEMKELPWTLLEYPLHQQMSSFVKDLNHLYRAYPALYEKDYDPDGFEWINCTSSKDSIAVFLRKTDKREDTLMVICNFIPVAKEAFPVGVPFSGKYKEIFNSDAAVYGGSGMSNPRAKTSRLQECDERDHSITIHIPPMSVLLFSCTPAGTTEGKKRMTVVKKKAAAPVPETKKKAAAAVAAPAAVKELKAKASEMVSAVHKKAT